MATATSVDVVPSFSGGQWQRGEAVRCGEVFFCLVGEADYNAGGRFETYFMSCTMKLNPTIFL
jgi:hypothetical protein